MNLTFYDLTRIITAFQLLLVIIFLLNYNKNNRISNKILAIFLFSEASYIISGIFFSCNTNLQVDFLYLFYIIYSFIFLFGPSLYLYTKSIASRDFQLKKIHIIHLLPFILFCILNTFVFNIASTDIELNMLSAESYYEIFIVLGLLHLQILTYIIASLFVLKNYSSEIKKVFSSIERINLSWLKFILFGFLLIWSIESTIFIINIATCIFSCTLKIVLVTLLFIMANLIVFQGLKQPEIFIGVNHKSKYEKSSLTKSDRERYLEKLISFMKSEKKYLIPNLTLNELAERVSINPHHLSQVLNTCLNQNFFDFINSYRIEESKKLLSEHSYNKKTILEILYETGFNSKSVFNTAFKKYTGMTPSQFRNIQNSRINSIS